MQTRIGISGSVMTKYKRPRGEGAESPQTVIYGLWPAKTDGTPGHNWDQRTRWLVLDMGAEPVKVLHGPVSRAEALAWQAKRRVAK